MARTRPQGELSAASWRLNVPDPLPVIDGLLAASARIRGWTLATRNTADLARSAVMLVNPFDPRPPHDMTGASTNAGQV